MGKERVKKIYRLLSSYSYGIMLRVNGRDRMFCFHGANPRSGTRGCFITDGPEEQEALEASPAFNQEYYLERHIPYKESTPDVPGTIVEVRIEDEKKEKSDNRTVEQPNGTRVDSVTNMTTAKMYLLSTYTDEKAEIGALKKADEVRAFATKKGIVFPNWE